MKKLALAFAILLIAAFFVTPVTASDFSAGGAYRFEAVSNDPGAGEKSEYFDQRFRVSFKWAVNDNVSAELRGDFAEMQWGDAYRPEAGNDRIMIDRATINLKQGPVNLLVGLIEPNLGLGTNWSYQMQGIQADFAFNPVTLTLIYGKESEGGLGSHNATTGATTLAGNALTDDGANDDTNLFAGQLTYAADAFTAGIHAAFQDNAANDTDKNGLGFFFSAPIGAGKLAGEIVTFNGDASATTEYAGTQFFIGYNTPVSETLSLGVEVIWAQDADANEVQITAVEDDANYTLLDWAGALGYNNAPLTGCGIFDVSGDGAGVMGIVGNVKFSASEALTLYAKLGYFEPKEDSKTNLDSKLVAIANFDYAVMPAVTLSGGISYAAPDYDDGSNDDEQIVSTLQLGVSF